jgi:ribosomal protein S18 acetylase RimI-like enzyme
VIRGVQLGGLILLETGVRLSLDGVTLALLAVGGAAIVIVAGYRKASGLLVQSGHVAGVYTIGVVEEFRRRGIGEAMTWEVLRTGRDAGCRVGVLQSSEMGYPLYERMGFGTVVTYHHFEPAT